MISYVTDMFVVIFFIQSSSLSL